MAMLLRIKVVIELLLRACDLFPIKAIKHVWVFQGRNYVASQQNDNLEHKIASCMQTAWNYKVLCFVVDSCIYIFCCKRFQTDVVIKKVKVMFLMT